MAIKPTGKVTTRRRGEKLREEVDNLQSARVEQLVDKRTLELSRLNELLRSEIDERRRAEECLLREKDFSEALISSLPGIFYVFDQHGKFLRWNKNLEEVSEYNPDEIAHMRATDFFEGEDKIAVAQRIGEVFSEGRAVVEADVVTKAKVRIPYLLTGMRTRIDESIYLVGMGIDVAEKKALEAETMRAGHLAALGELAAGVAHEINNPIQGIINCAQILIDQSETQGGDTQIPRMIIKEGQRVAYIVKNLLSFARNQKERHGPVLVKEIVDDSLGLVGRQLIRDGIKLEVNVPSDLPRIKARGQQIKQVFLNVISNARYALNRKFAHVHPDKRLEITAEAMAIDERRIVRLIFKDRGTGIPRSIVGRICDPFFSTKPRGEGTGLGLSISYGIIKDHGGWLSFESAEGEYTKVVIHLPVYGLEDQ